MLTWVLNTFGYWSGGANVDSDLNPYDPANEESDANNPPDAMPRPKVTKDKAGRQPSILGRRAKSSNPSKANPSSQTGRKHHDVAGGGQGARLGTRATSTNKTSGLNPTTSASPDPKSPSNPTSNPVDQPTKSQPPPQHTTSKAARETSTTQPSPAELQLQRQYEALEAKYKELEEKHKAQEALFQIRSRELHGVEVYTLSANTDDELNVIGAIDQLNNTIEHGGAAAQ